MDKDKMEQGYLYLLEDRKIAADPKIRRCSCPNVKCEWHGRCTECVALHRHYKNHLPVCLQPIVTEKLKELAATVEMSVSPAGPDTREFWDYVKRRDAEEATK